MNDRPNGLHGLIAAPFTAMRPDARLHLELIQQQAQRLADNGVLGAFICGTTGEGFSLTTEERMQVAERWLAVAPKQLRVIVHVAHNSQGESRKLAAQAEQIGAYASAGIKFTDENLMSYTQRLFRPRWKPLRRRMGRSRSRDEVAKNSLNSSQHQRCLSV
jgi:hypothetical protein